MRQPAVIRVAESPPLPAKRGRSVAFYFVLFVYSNFKALPPVVLTMQVVGRAFRRTSHPFRWGGIFQGGATPLRQGSLLRGIDNLDLAACVDTRSWVGWDETIPA